MYIGEASKKTGLSIKAIRFYEAKGLIKPPERVGRYRVYHSTDIELLLLIKEAKDIGVTLSQLRSVIEFNKGVVDWRNIKLFLAEIRQQLVREMEVLSQKIENLDQCYQQIKD